MESDAAREQFERFSRELSPEVKEAVWDLLEYGDYWDELFPEGDVLELEVPASGSCRRVLKLQGVSNVPEGADHLRFESLIKREDGYRLVGEFEDYSLDQTGVFTIRFTDVSLESTVFRADFVGLQTTPWEYLSYVACQILAKAEQSDALLCSKERELLPLLQELGRLVFYVDLPAGEQMDFPRLKSCCREQGFPELLPLLDRLARKYASPGRARIGRQLLAKLNSGRYEPLFRSLWQQLEASQKDYPTEAQARFSPAKLSGLRRRIQNRMQLLGFEGTYPDYHKTGSIKGIRLAESYGLDYFVYAEKHAVSYIHCREVAAGGLCIELLCGTRLPRKNQDPGDVVSCLFNTRGRSFYRTVLCPSEELDIKLPVAAKLSQLQKLTREEKAQLSGTGEPLWLVFLLWLILGGGAFGLLFTLAMMLFDVLICLIDGTPVRIWEAPWLQIFLFTSVGFGTLMGAAMTLIGKLKS